MVEVKVCSVSRPYNRESAKGTRIETIIEAIYSKTVETCRSIFRENRSFRPSMIRTSLSLKEMKRLRSVKRFRINVNRLETIINRISAALKFVASIRFVYDQTASSLGIRARNHACL